MALTAAVAAAAVAAPTAILPVLAEKAVTHWQYYFLPDCQVRT
jgi:hypothetical protein